MSTPIPDDETDEVERPSAAAAQQPEATEAVDAQGAVDDSVPEEVDEYAAQRGGYGVSLETG